MKNGLNYTMAYILRTREKKENEIILSGENNVTVVYGASIALYSREGSSCFVERSNIMGE
jgi:hypothetical protein